MVARGKTFAPVLNLSTKALLVAVIVRKDGSIITHFLNKKPYQTHVDILMIFPEPLYHNGLNPTHPEFVYKVEVTLEKYLFSICRLTIETIRYTDININPIGPKLKIFRIIKEVK